MMELLLWLFMPREPKRVQAATVKRTRNRDVIDVVARPVKAPKPSKAPKEIQYYVRVKACRKHLAEAELLKARKAAATKHQIDMHNICLKFNPKLKEFMK